MRFDILAEQTIQSQYATSPHIRGIIDGIRRVIDPTLSIDEFYERYFDPRTAVGIGLDIWGIIVGIYPRMMEIGDEETFGFHMSKLHPFGQAPFKHTSRTNYRRLADSAYRDLVFFKALANIGDATLPGLKARLSALIKNPVLMMRTAATSTGDMKVRIVFETYLTPWILAILKLYGTFGLGAGVGFEYIQIKPKETFGFNGSKLQPFNCGVFRVYGIQDEDGRQR